MNKEDVKKILVVRFRQIGDAILATALCSTLKHNFPDAEIHFVLNKGIAPLFEGHPDIDRIITFDKNELKPLPKYMAKVWRVVHENHYDVIIDMRSTVNTLMFSAFSLSTPFRIGVKKGYTRFVLTDEIDNGSRSLDLDMVKRNLMLCAPLVRLKEISAVEDFTISITDKERGDFRKYMESEGIDFSRPVILVGVTTKILSKRWNTSFMVETLRRILEHHPDFQLIFNYVPGIEEADARKMFEELGAPSCVKINIQARSLRELAALCANCNFYYGNEGGARHLAQALGVPSFAIFSPIASPRVWLPQNVTPAHGISVDDVIPLHEQAALTNEERFDRITPDEVMTRLDPLLDRL